MNQVAAPALPQTRPQQKSVNPFARALAETEQNTYSKPTPPTEQLPSAFNDALTRSGGQFGDISNNISPDVLQQQQQEAKRQQQRELLRRKLHDQINPVDTTAVFDAREREVKKQIDHLRSELKLLGKDISKFEKEVEMTLMTEVTEPGQQGSYYLSFFHQLRSFIMFLRQKIKSASTWLRSSKSKKAKKGKQPGLVIGGLGHEKTSTVQDMMHHERSSTYGGS